MGVGLGCVGGSYMTMFGASPSDDWRVMIGGSRAIFIYMGYIRVYVVMDRMLKKSLGLDLWHLVALIVVLMYVRFVFHKLTAYVPLLNRVGNDSMSYYVADSLAALLFVHIMMTRGRAIGTVAGVGLVWLALNYISKLNYSSRKWYAHDGFALAVILAAYIR